MLCVHNKFNFFFINYGRNVTFHGLSTVDRLKTPFLKSYSVIVIRIVYIVT